MRSSYKYIILISMLILFVSGQLYAKEYTTTSYYVAYDKDDKSQYALVLPSVNKVYTHQAGHILAADLKRIDTEFSSFPTYNNGKLCFSSLADGASGENGASVMANQCYEVNFFYTQKDLTSDGEMAFILTYVPTDTVYEGIAGKSESFKVVKSGTTIENVNSVTHDDYDKFLFYIGAAKALFAEEDAVLNTPPVAQDMTLQTEVKTSVSGSFAVTDAEDSYLKYYIVSKPSNGSVLSHEDSSHFSYIPNDEFVGTDSFTYRAYDGQTYSEVKHVTIDVNGSTVLNSGDTTDPGKAIILSINSPSSNIITLFWLGATDDVTSPSELRYEVHCSTQKDFTPDESSRKVTVKGVMEADVTGLEENTLYYVKVKTLDNGDNSSVSDEMNITTAKKDDVILNSANRVKTADDLFLHDAVVTDTQITYVKTDKSILPQVGDILVDNSESPSLVKVKNIAEQDGKVVIETEDATFSDVFSDMKTETKTVLYDPQQITTSSSNVALTSFKSYSYSTPVQQGYTWSSGRFKILQPTATEETTAASLNNLKMSSISTVGSYVKISSPQDEEITVTSGEALSIELLAELNEGDTSGFDKDDINRVISEFTLVSVEHDGETDSNNFGFSMSTTNEINGSKRGIVRFIATDARASTEPYILTLRAKAGWLDITGFDTWEESEEEVTIKVSVLTKDLEATEGFRLTLTDNGENTTYSFPIFPDFTLPNKTKHNYTVTATAGVDIDFTPTMVTELDIDKKYVKVLLGGEMTFTLDSSFNISGELTQTYDFNLTALDKKFINLYSAGPIPIYQEIDITWRMQITPSAKGEIDVSNKMEKVFNVNFGVECVGSECTNLSSKDSSSTYTASVKVGAEATLEVRLIPEVSVRFYRAATATLSVEPWIKSGVAAEGEASYASDFTNYDMWLSYNLKELSATVGLDGYLSADLTVCGWELYKYPSDKPREELFGVKTDIFSLPTLGIEQLNASEYIKDRNITLQAVTEDGIRTNVDLESIQWYVYPDYGATITKDATNPKKATLQVNSFGEYTVYFVANSAQLSGTFGQQRAEIHIDMRDNDGDQMADRWEEVYGLNPIDASDGSADADGDGYSNLIEYQQGTNPEDKEDYPVVTNPSEDVDTTPPVISIIGDNPATVTKGSTYADEGATAVDDVDGDVDVNVLSNDVDTATVGTYYVVYSAKDNAGNEVNASRVVNVINDDVLVSLNNKVVIWKDEVPNDDGSDTQTYQFMLALYEDQTCSFVGLNLDINITEEAEETEEDTNQINVSASEILTDITPCEWSSDDEVLSLVLTDNDIEVNVSLVEGTIKAGDDFDLLCDDSNGCTVEKVYDVAVLAENNVSSHAITTMSDDGNIYTWYFNSDNTISIYEDGNTTVQFEGNWTVSDSYIDILDSEGNVVLRASNTTYKTGDYLDFTYVKGYISDIGIIEIPVGSTATLVKKTGQAKSYDEDGNEVTDGSLKDDGYYQKGVTPSYSRDDDKEIVTDHITGLMWQDNSDVENVTKPWLTQVNYDICIDNNSAPECYDTSGDTAATYCSNLTLGGYSDWRLPTSKELEGIVDYGRYNPAVDTTYVQYISLNYYWSSTTNEYDHKLAWLVNFSNGFVSKVTKDTNYYVRCIRYGQ